MADHLRREHAMVNILKPLFQRAHASATFHRLAVRAHALRRPPSYRRPDMEFDFDVWNGISSFHAHDGRQIGENNTAPSMYRERIATEHRVCKFEGTRSGLQMNVTALRSVMGVWDEALQFVMLARERHLRHTGHSGPQMNLRQAYVFSKMAAAYVAFLVRRRAEPIADGELSALEAAFFTLGVGPFMVVRALMERGDLRALDTQPLSGEQVYELAEASRALISGDKVACAGSRKLIVQFLDVALNGRCEQPLDAAQAHAMVARVGDWGVFSDYVFASSRVELLVKLHRVACAHAVLAFLADEGAQHPDHVAAARQCLDRCHHQAGVELDEQTTVRHFACIALALLDELGATEACQVMREAGLLERGDHGWLLRPVHGDGPRAQCAEVARFIDAATSALHPLCDHEMARVHAALGWPHGAAITPDRLLLRSGGPALVSWLARLRAEGSVSA
jgi:hypothetical protein